MKDSTIIIDRDIADTASKICSSIQPEDKRCRALSNVFAANMAGWYFDDEDCDVQSGLHNSSSVLNDIDIADIYIKNSFIDVRLYFNENELCVPKAHFEYGILPVAYMFIKVDSDLSEGFVQGFITPSDVDRDTEINGYYRVDENSLIPFYNIEDLLNAPNQQDVDLDAEIQIYDFIDGKIENKAEFYKKLIESRELRLTLLRADETKRFIKHLPKDILTSDEEVQEFNNDSTQEELPDELLQVAGVEESVLLEETEGSIEENVIMEDAPVNDLISDTNDEFELEEYADNIESVELDVTDNTEPLTLNEEDTFAENTEEPSETSNIIADLYAEENIANTADEAISIVENEPDNQFMNEEVPVQEEPASETIYEEIPTAKEPEEDVVSQEIQETQEPNITENEINENYSTEVTPSLEIIEDEPAPEVTEPETDNDEHDNLDKLFASSEDDENIPLEYNKNIPKNKKGSPSFLKGLLILALLAGIGYFGYTKYTQTQMPANDTIPQSESTETADNNKPDDAMPVETIENHAAVSTKNEGTSVDVPEIERSLDASVLVSNLSISWEVPAAYLTNTSAKRYFTKIGKILQLQLKTELLLVSKPPLNNRIVVDLEYDKNAGAFNIKDISTSSGEKTIDNTVRKTVENVLKTDLNINTSSFGNIQGNPMLIIKL